MAALLKVGSDFTMNMGHCQITDELDESKWL